MIDIKTLTPGTMVKILEMDLTLSRDDDYKIGEVCEVRGINECKEIEVFTSDKSDYWFFEADQLELV